VSIPPAMRGTYAGLAHLAPYLRALGFSTIELLPVHHAEAGREAESGPDSNFWGYMTLGYFAPNRRYAFDRSPGGPTREFQQMVRALHDAGIEVYLDVVYNHTGEAGNWMDRPDTTGFVSLGGFDAAEYYMSTENGFIVEGATGCGNQLNCSSPAAHDLVLDSLQYWIDAMGIDGFRFDLAPVLGRTPNAFERTAWESQKRFFPEHPLLVEIRDLGRRHSVEMIAEAWDLWGYEVGNFPSEWGEWNGRYRDAVRHFLRGDGNAREFAEMVNGDFAHFADNGGAGRSIDFVDAHDGFTMLDLVSYAQKNNQQPWPFGPSDGGNDDNASSDSGGQHARRRQQLRNIWTLLIYSRGIPMAVYGDELGRTQNGNNNPWCLDSVATWTNYRQIATCSPTALPTEGGGTYHDNFGTAEGQADRNPLFVFVRYLMKIRQQSPVLGRTTGGSGPSPVSDVPYRFVREDGHSGLCADNRCVMVLIDGHQVGERDTVLFINSWREPVSFAIPAGRVFRRIIDTAVWAEAENNCWSREQAPVVGGAYQVHPYSTVVLEEQGS
jgi:isoamylase